MSSVVRRIARFVAVGTPMLMAVPTDAMQGNPGEVLSYNKISQTTPSWGAVLDTLDQFGRSACTPGDIDGDGVFDLVVGAHGDDDGGTMANGSDLGALWVMMMNPDGSIKTLSKISELHGNFSGELQQRDGFGRCVSPIGDWDGDGVPDIAAGAPREDDGGASNGAFWMILLNADGSVKQHQKISELAGNLNVQFDIEDEFGRDVSDLGDIDGDGVKDLAVGCIGDDDGGDFRGAVYILFMNQDMTVKSHQKISSTVGGFAGPLNNGDSFGVSTSSLGDLDGDGVTDIAVGAAKDDDGGNRFGSVWILFLNSDGTCKASQKISDSQGNFPGPYTGSDEFGTSTEAIGDLDGDGVMDLAVGAILDDEIGDDKGAVWILFLNTDGTVKNHQKINTLHGNFNATLDDSDWFGSAVAPLGDWNGDGILDMIGGARFDDDGGAHDRGAIYMLYLDGDVNQAPHPEFEASVVTGDAALEVTFTDLSFPQPTAWLWDFGDGNTSTDQHPVHTYTMEGNYSVSLSVTGPGGSDAELKTDYVMVTSVPLDDPSFELQTPGTDPVAPWLVSFGDENVVNPDGFTTDGDMPTEGANWLEVSAEGTDNATPPTVPGGVTAPPVGAAGVSQEFTYPGDETVLVFDAAFLRNGAASDAAFNDFMSVDVSDGVTTVNLYYADTFTPTPLVSAKYGHEMTEVERVVSDLGALFPGSHSSTVFTLTIQVGNGGDGLAPSLGYVDDLRFAQPRLLLAYGDAVNPAGSLTVLSGDSQIGGSVTFGLDNPLGTQPAGSYPVLLLARNPDPNFPNGTSLPNLGMSAPGALGEILISLNPPTIFLFGAPWDGAGMPAPISINLPNKEQLVGRDYYVQGMIWDLAGTSGIDLGVTTAYHMRLGF